MFVHPRAEPLYAGSGRIGVLLSHGFTGSPASMRPWAEDLVEHGYRVAAPRLPGHGTRWQDMQRTGWQDWYAAVERAFLGLAEQCSTVVVGGQSMGGCLALRLAARHGAAVAGVVLVNPALWSKDARLLALPVLRHLVPSLPGIGNDVHKPATEEWSYDRMPLHALSSMTKLWRVVSTELPTVTQPLLVFRSAEDHVLDGSSLRLLRSRVGSRDVSEHVLPDSYHVATLDYDAPTLFATTRRFLDRLRSDRREPAPTSTQAPQGEGSAR